MMDVESVLAIMVLFGGREVRNYVEVGRREGRYRFNALFRCLDIMCNVKKTYSPARKAVILCRCAKDIIQVRSRGALCGGISNFRFVLTLRFYLNRVVDT